ncbi:MAG: hypothetical protein GXP31_12015 [Kiritimatiellaeota bacterium]|nr:hypothetical protein [Kiritimatiellota bacterium]
MKLFFLLAPAAVIGAELDIVRCGNVTLGFDLRNGQWRSLQVEGTEYLAGTTEGPADLEVRAEPKNWPRPAAWKSKPVRVVRADGETTVFVERRAPLWEATLIYRVRPNVPEIVRRGKIRFLGPGRVQVRQTLLRLPGITLEGAADAVWAVPGNYPTTEHSVRNTAPGFTEREQGWTWAETGVAFVHSARAGRGLAVAYELGEDGARVAGEQGKGSVSLLHRFRTLARLDPGEEIEIGTQWVRLVQGNRLALKQACRQLATAVNHGPPADRPAWLEGAVFMEVHPWGRLEEWTGGDRGRRLPDLEATLPELQRLGVTALWLLPVSQKPPWVYQLPTFRRIAPEIGTPEQLRAFFAAAHGLGLRALMDLVTYGIAPDSPDVRELPDSVWCRDESGKRIKAWGNTVLAADCSNPAWREHMVNLARYWVREFGCDGFRLDCGGSGQAPNWRPRLGARANSAMLAGGIGQNVLIRQAIRAINPDAILMPEAGAACHYRAADLLFDYPLYRACREITRAPDIALWIERLRNWMAERQFTISPAQEAAMVRFIENHDCVAAQDFFGVGPSQALAALCTFLPGVPLLYQGQPTGFAPELRRWLRLRRDIPALRRGKAEYRAVAASSPGVLAFLRYTAEDAAVVAVNFTPRDVRCTFAWPREFDARLGDCREALSGTAATRGMPVTVPAWRPVVLTGSRARVLPALLTSLDKRPGSGSLVLSRKMERTETDRDRYIIRLAPLTRWFVQTHEGLLLDRFPERPKVKPGENWVDTVLPLRRCWRPLETGLFDGPGPARLGGIAADGRAVELRIPQPTELRDIRIEDPAGAGNGVRIEIEQPAGPPRFTLTEVARPGELLEHLSQFTSAAGPPGLVAVGPLWVRIETAVLSADLARRHGGTLAQLTGSGERRPWLAGPSEVYSDWGLFTKGLHTGSDWETNPRLELDSIEDGAAAVTFRGRLRRPSWNGVQFGQVMRPAVHYRLRYELFKNGVLRVTLGLTPTTERPDTKAFFALRVPLAGIEEWRAEGQGGEKIAGRRGEHPGARAFETVKHPWSANGCTLQLGRTDGRLILRTGGGAGNLPQNAFLLESGNGNFTLFFALLNGQPATLEAGREITAGFELRVE